MSLFTPIFDRRGLQVAWLIDNSHIFSLSRELVASIANDGTVSSNREELHLGGFVDDLFFDTSNLPVAFIDRTIASDSPPDGKSPVSPILARGIDQWSNRSWQQFFDVTSNQ